jgi:hypothetical protein
VNGHDLLLWRRRALFYRPFTALPPLCRTTLQARNRASGRHAATTKKRTLAMHESIQLGDMAFISDGGEGIGSVREIRPEPPELVIYIENAGDFEVPMSAVRGVHSGKVVLDCARLEPRLREATRHVRDAADPSYQASTGNAGEEE